MIRDIRQRVESKTLRGEGCWAWSGAHANTGYAQVRENKKLHYVHRLVYAFHNGSVPDGMVVDHKCHNRGCINPEHLQAVSPKQNNENRSGPARNNTSGYRGVYRITRSGKWGARLKDGPTVHREEGFATAAEAAKAASRMRATIFTNSLLDMHPAAPGDND
ncbi:HNH endonuclease signature motif containing protein [Microbacterium sp. NPDC078814]|uniref:HNH endonuclease signature motif containing protein n=1 Tax=Microbacterium sp. NPDC078814 TaxID=3154767 RepID=UPI00344E4E62